MHRNTLLFLRVTAISRTRFFPWPEARSLFADVVAKQQLLVPHVKFAVGDHRMRPGGRSVFGPERPPAIAKKRGDEQRRLF